MGNFIKQDSEMVYQQDDGEITAWFYDFEEKMELSHKGTSMHQKLFYLLVAAGLIYLTVVFVFY